MARRSKQLALVYRRKPGRRGGARKGAGRPPKNGVAAGVPHAPRPKLTRHTPVHVTMRLLPGVRRLRQAKQYRAIRRALHHVNQRVGFRVCHFSIQGNHYHLLVEANDRRTLGHGMAALNIRVAKAINRLHGGGRKGTIFGDRYHCRLVTTPSQARNALLYVLNNALRHGEAWAARTMVDPYSSGDYFDGWQENAGGARPPPDDCVVVEAKSWLLTTGWRRRGLLHPLQQPGSF
jgi:REP element-mobilizing transposase RayT